MQIVIDIPEETYEALVINQYCGSKSELENIIVNGTPLPEHHGRLIDSEALGNYFWDNRSKLFEYKDLQIAIDNAPTIIEGSDAE